MATGKAESAAAVAFGACAGLEHETSELTRRAQAAAIAARRERRTVPGGVI
jgi:hypothetical protein